MNKNKLFIILVLLIVFLVACEPDSKIKDPETNKSVDIYYVEFNVYCDLKKGLAIAVSDLNSNVSGMLTHEDFLRFCGTVAEQDGKTVK